MRTTPYYGELKALGYDPNDTDTLHRRLALSRCVFVYGLRYVVFRLQYLNEFSPNKVYELDLNYILTSDGIL